MHLSQRTQKRADSNKPSTKQTKLAPIKVINQTPFELRLRRSSLALFVSRCAKTKNTKKRPTRTKTRNSKLAPAKLPVCTAIQIRPLASARLLCVVALAKRSSHLNEQKLASRREFRSNRIQLDLILQFHFSCFCTKLRRKLQNAAGNKTRARFCRSNQFWRAFQN